jgi:hypothetical protein
MAGEPKTDGRSDNDVQYTRSWTGLFVVVAGDIAIALAAVVAGVLISHHSSTPAAVGSSPSGSGLDTSSMVSILASAFTAIGTMTTAYFGIRAATNTAQTSMRGPGSKNGIAAAGGGTPPAGQGGAPVGGAPAAPGSPPAKAAATKAAPAKAAPGKQAQPPGAGAVGGDEHAP